MPKPPKHWRMPKSTGLRRRGCAGGLRPPAHVRSISTTKPLPAEPDSACLLDGQSLSDGHEPDRMIQSPVVTREQASGLAHSGKLC
jgi:hypothetical protein